MSWRKEKEESAITTHLESTKLLVLLVILVALAELLVLLLARLQLLGGSPLGSDHLLLGDPCLQCLNLFPPISLPSLHLTSEHPTLLDPDLPPAASAFVDFQPRNGLDKRSQCPGRAPPSPHRQLLSLGPSTGSALALDDALAELLLDVDGLPLRLRGENIHFARNELCRPWAVADRKAGATAGGSYGS